MLWGDWKNPNCAKCQVVRLMDSEETQVLYKKMHPMVVVVPPGIIVSVNTLVMSTLIKVPIP